MTFADKVIAYNRKLEYTGLPLPPGIRVMNPFRENPQALEISEAFYRKYYNDEKPRYLILGINPGRFGASLTGVPFTDPKRLEAVCGLTYEGKASHEPSSVFIYEMINAYGGPEKFYGDFFINSLSPLGYVAQTANGKEKNYNYYDSPSLLKATIAYIVQNIRQVHDLGVFTDCCFCLGTGQNEKFLRKLNQEHHFFPKIEALEHPRFIMQYRQKTLTDYIEKYLNTFRKILDGKG
ncbi:uracil-DNA glycosylase family protein [Pedobacter sp. SYP-B3415]|uniref:uracil-DNA glycosylase family protein n=1 Tax=Pedobacter sp. SYP-B3415 TaxID=2496641 RepID=UPI00101C83E0|nr:uracil-DNA glycosylase family protein [Pedobacter sp. SYP-B3415]